MTRRKQVKRTVRVVSAERTVRKRDYLASEEPLEIQLRAGGARKTVAITMRTPGNDYELAAGFLYSEGVIAATPAIPQWTLVHAAKALCSIRSSTNASSTS